MKTKERGGGVYLTFQKGVLPDFPRAFELIESGGFKARKDEVDLVVTGRLSPDKGTVVITLDEMKDAARFVLLASTAKGGEAAFAQVKELASKPDSPLVELEGRWQPNASGSPPALRVVRVEPKRNP